MYPIKSLKRPLYMYVLRNVLWAVLAVFAFWYLTSAAVLILG